MAGAAVLVVVGVVVDEVAVVVVVVNMVVAVIVGVALVVGVRALVGGLVVVLEFVFVVGVEGVMREMWKLRGSSVQASVILFQKAKSSAETPLFLPGHLCSPAVVGKSLHFSLFQRCVR